MFSFPFIFTTFPVLMVAVVVVNGRIICRGSPPAYEYELCRCDDQTADGSYPYLECWNKGLSDRTVSQYLNAFLFKQPNITALKRLQLGNNKLTRVPDEIKMFIELEYVDLRYNSIHTIHSGAFHFTSILKWLYLQYNQLSNIEPGAFQGNYGESSWIFLDNNNLTRLDSNVFQTVLEKMRLYGRVPFAALRIDNNSIDCETDYCHLAWLIRDNRLLIQSIRSGYCSNGTALEMLDPNAYDNCPQEPDNSRSRNFVSNLRNSRLCPTHDSILPCVCEFLGDETLNLDCYNKELDDERVNEILKSFAIGSNATLLTAIELSSNVLTRVPHQIHLFPQLQRLNLARNKIHTIHRGELNFSTAPLQGLWLDHNQLTNIEPEAIHLKNNNQKYFYIYLSDNNWTRLEANVFQTLLEEIKPLAPFAARAYLNPIDCETDPCHLAWLITDNRHLLKTVSFQECSNGTSLANLSPFGFNHCTGFATKTKEAEENLPVIDSKMVIALSLIVAAVVSALLVVLIVILLRYQKKKTNASPYVKDLLKGKPEAVNPDLPLDEQTELLPYDKKIWEFPRHQLKLGIQLGAGAFGRVVKAEATGLVKNDESITTVAVKMVRSQGSAEPAALEALVNELKILMHVGSDVNVVNLLGACTKNIFQGDLLVIVDYCRYGNLQSYLTKNRKSFIRSSVAVEVKSTDYEVESDGLVESEGYEVPIQLTRNNDRHGAESSASSATNSVSTGGSSQHQPPDWCWNYQADIEEIQNRSITTRDLICWSFQVARGMDYLARKKVLHGDLAARNVLLADDNVVKVADFGLARKLYNDSNYKKQSRGLLPMKWMAIESLTDNIFSTQSDVWSFGVFLWEIFSLGKMPYPGTRVDQHFIRKLKEGYRLEKPEIASNSLAWLMNQCWKSDPRERPSFRRLEEALRRQL